MTIYMLLSRRRVANVELHWLDILNIYAHWNYLTQIHAHIYTYAYTQTPNTSTHNHICVRVKKCMDHKTDYIEK